ALGEDSAAESLAGQFTSVPHVVGETQVVEAIDRVVASYETPQSGDQIFLQPQLRSLTISGVAFSIDPITGGPYLVVNDQRSADTGEVTGGIACDDELFYWLRGTELPTEPHLMALISLMRELESLLGRDALDIEFAWADDTLFLLQVRPLVRVRRTERSPMACHQSVREIATALERRRSAFPQVLGTGIAWGAMPDWNPAEMIGLRPRPLAAGLYRECITDRIWAEQRRRYGYRDVTGVPLMECFGGQALIDIRASFTSFVPAACSDSLAQCLVESALTELRSRPELHDKVEMELLHHCWTFDLREKLRTLPERAGLQPLDCAAVEQTLRDLTWRMMDPHAGPWSDDRRRMAAFAQWLTDRMALRRPVTPADIRIMLRQCRDAGGLAFAGLARVGFVAVAMLNSLVQMGVWTEEDRERFFRSQQTVLSQMHVDRSRLPMTEFLSRYGHLRPGTYDILVQRYDEAPEQYHLHAPLEPLSEPPPFRLADITARATSSLLLEHHFSMDLDACLHFLGEAIQFREYGKFVYSRGISELLRMLGEYAATLGLSRDDCSYADQSLWDDAVSDDEFPHRLRQAIAAGRTAERASRGIVLPPLLFSTDELQSFRMPRCQPNYVTHGVGCGPVCELQSVMEETDGPPDLRGMVVLLPSADPGYDWIFSTGIVAFVTKFGGANSHMAIRAREWNLPAAIGVGEVRYRRLVQARALRVDCLHQLLVTLP
ncbi:MAG: PEP-utilizing enzyme, partial [Planctomycetaceae bacterium]|nr:PEP-utilizing enzyme [Planctomycetaceae bacterium]